jgi:hypothetical protein
VRPRLLPIWRSWLGTMSSRCCTHSNALLLCAAMYR